MKKEIHPKYYPAASVACSCGERFTVGATQPELKIEICSACHPFFSGTEKVLDTAGRVEKFKTRRAAAAKTPTKKKPTPSKSRPGVARGGRHGKLILQK